MVNRGLQQEDVFQAAIEIERLGEKPSAKKIREHLGSGSLTTISKYFKMWQVQKPTREDTKELDLNIIFKDIDCEVPNFPKVYRPNFHESVPLVKLVAG